MAANSKGKKRNSKRTRKRKGKIVIAQNAVIRKRHHSSSDSFPKAKTELPRDNGANFKITIRRKRD